MSIYTRTGDKGETGLANGERVHKSSEIISFVGHLDELNAYIGYSISTLKHINQFDFSKEIKDLESIQNKIFVIGSISVFAKLEFELEKEVKYLENLIDDYEKTLPKLTNFILPGGHIASSQVHLLRTSARKVEILAHSLSHEDISKITPFLNRLSDYLFVLARFINFKLNFPETIWKIS